MATTATSARRPRFAVPVRIPRPIGSGQLYRLPIRGRPADRPEPDALVEPERAADVLRVDVQRAFGHAPLAKRVNGLGDEGPGQSALPPRPPHRDVLDPAPVRPEPLVLVVVDEAADLARDLVAVPGDP